MRAFITGATGFIGTHLVNRLAQTEHELCCLVRRDSNVQHLNEVGATLVVGDVTDRESLLAGMGDCDWVIHLAGIYSYWERSRKVYAEVNVNGTSNVMESALDADVGKVIHVSTAAVYGKPADTPFSEESPVGPVRFSRYAQTKYEGELAAWKLYEERGLPLVVLYPGATLGPGDSKPTGQYITDLIHRQLPITAFKDAVVTFVHVGDVAEAIVKAAEKDDNIGERYLVGKHQMSLRELDEMVGEISGIPLPSLRLPDLLVKVNAALLTSLADLTKKHPVWRMSSDLMRTTREGFRFDGRKAETQLGVAYTPIRVAVEEAIASYAHT